MHDLDLIFFFNDTATTEIYTLSLHDALPIFRRTWGSRTSRRPGLFHLTRRIGPAAPRSEEHTSELQSQSNLVCRLLLEKKKKSPQCALSRTRRTSRTPATAFW